MSQPQAAQSTQTIQPTTPASTAPLGDSARRAWTINFVVPAPKSMPSDRMKARAELVRSATGCCNVY